MAGGLLGLAARLVEYAQDEEAVVYIGEFAEDRPFPDAADFLDLLHA
ncbi:hypothetical protein ACIBTV_24085 [Micromonospora sp. NPDC049366]